MEHPSVRYTQCREPQCAISSQEEEVSCQNDPQRLKSTALGNAPGCTCFPPDHIPAEPGPYYTQLGYTESLAKLREEFEKRTGLAGKAIRLEKVKYTGKEGKTSSGCPLGKWVIRRSGPEEKVLLLIKNRKGHACATSWIVIASVVWDGIPSPMADDLYTNVGDKLKKFGLATSRRCGVNTPRTCACQGLDSMTCGASFAFGCSWSTYFSGCKFARGETARKFKLSDNTEEHEIESRLQFLASFLSPLCEMMAPDSYSNMIQYEAEAEDCRLGLLPGCPWSGLTVCCDFCAHAHRDWHDMDGGCTAVVTLTKHRGFEKPSDEQFHVLPLYVIDDSDEHGSKEGHLEKIKSGAIEVLTKYPCEIRKRHAPLLSRRKLENKIKNEREDAKRALAGQMRTKEDYSSTSPQTTNRKWAKKRQMLPSWNTPEAEPQTLLGSVTDFTNNEKCFLDPNVGGVAISLCHGAVMFEVAKHEIHATTALKEPNRLHPSRISLVFYQHRDLNKYNHGKAEWKDKQRKKKELAESAAEMAEKE